MDRYLGEVAALVTALCWALTSIQFDVAGRRIGAQVANLTRLLIALAALLILNRWLYSAWLPLNATSARWGWLALSGTIGLGLGDAALFQSLKYVGPRLTMLLLSLAPLATALLGWLILWERLGWVDVVAIPLTVGGVMWVVLEQRGNHGDRDPRHFRLGVLFGILGALGQAAGVIASRFGLSGDYPVISANLIRTLAAGGLLLGYSIVAGQVRGTITALRDMRGLLAVTGGTLTGPLLGVLLNLYSIQKAPVGIAATLTSITPIFMLPLGWWIYRERITARALGGTVLALLGVALILLY